MSLAPCTPRRVVITGLSIACALGFDLDEFWLQILAGRSGIRSLPFLPADSPLPCRIGGCIDDSALQAALEPLGIKDPDRSSQLALFAARRALDHAGLHPTAETPLDYTTIVGSGHGNSIFHHEVSHAFISGGYRKLRPTTVVRLMFNRPANLVSIDNHLTGVNFCVSAACATGSIALATAFHHVRFGLAPGALAVCADAGIDDTGIAAWNRLGVLSRHTDPATACRPFDRDRDGLVMGEGAAGFVLEPLETAQARGAVILAEIIGVGGSSDAKHIVQPDPVGQVKAIRQALAQAGITPEQIDYVNAHGTATKLADEVEAASLLEALGPSARQVPVSNTKAQLGHLMGATAGAELVTTILALQHNLIPHCRNLDHPDPACPLHFVRHQPLAHPIHIALKNSFAFGGTNSAILFRKYTS